MISASLQGSGINDPTTTMEELYSLLLITGHVLADEGEGETPLVIHLLTVIFLQSISVKKFILRM